MLWLLTAYLGFNAPIMWREIQARHWRDVIVQSVLTVLSVLLTLSYEWEIPQLILPFSWLKTMFEQLSNVLYQPF